MKLSKDQKVRLGLFWTIGGGLTIIIFALVLGGRIFEERDTYFIEFKNRPVSGLQVGSSVQYQGIQVGRVEDIRFNKDDPSNVTVVLSLQEGVPIKQDVEAQLTMVGITGIRQISLIGGSANAEPLEPGGTIPTGQSLFDSITGDAQVITQKIEQALNNINSLLGPENQQKVRNILAGVESLVASEGGALSRTIANLEAASVDLRSFAETAVQVADDVDRVTGSEEWDVMAEQLFAGIEDFRLAAQDVRNATDHPALETFAEDLDTVLTQSITITEQLNTVTKDLAEVQLAEIASDVSEMLEQFRQTFTQMDLTIIRSSRDILESLDILNEILEDLSEFSRRISEDPSSLIQF